MQYTKHLIEMPKWTPEKLKALIRERKIVIWGAGLYGKTMLMALNRNGFNVTIFCDNNNDIVGHNFMGGGGVEIPIVRASDFLKTISREHYFVIACGGHPGTRKSMLNELKKYGFCSDQDCISYRSLNRFVPSIDVSGMCNLKCIGCPRGNNKENLRNIGFMSAKVYRSVLEKLIREIPLLAYVELYLWSEPFLNPELPEIIRISNELNVGTFISTNLNVSKNLEEIIIANPSEIKFQCSGYGDSKYSDIQSGAKWDVFYDNLRRLSEYKVKHKSNTRLHVYYIAYGTNLDDYPKVYKLVKTLHGVEMSVMVNHPFAEYVMDYYEGKELPNTVKDSIEQAYPPLDEREKYLKATADKFCMDKYAFPNISWDGSVFACTGYSNSILTDNYTGTTFANLIELHNNSELCQRCQKHSLHRWYAGKEYVPEINKIIKEKYGIPATIAETMFNTWRTGL